MENTAKKHAAHGFSQFALTQNLLNNLQQFELTPTAKLVLLYLSSCYNPKKADMFPKQKTIAAKIGVSEASVIRAISELHKQGLIISERKYTNRYKFTARIVAEPPTNEKNFTSNDMQVETLQNENKKLAKCEVINNEPIIEQINNPKDDKILVQYAKQKGVKNILPYINAIKRNGNAEAIIQEYKQIQANAQGMVAKARKVQEDLAFARANRAENISSDFFESVRKNCSAGGKNV